MLLSTALRDFPRSGVLLSLLLAMAFAMGCDRHVEPYVPGEEPERPDLSRIFPPERDSGEPEGPAELPAPPGPAPGAPPAPPSAAGTPSARSGAPVRGVVSVSPELADRVPQGGVLFVFARSLGGGPPVAARRIPSPGLPLQFELGPGDRMVEGIPFRGPFQLVARIDADGNATTRTPGDLQGTSVEPVSPGDTDVTVVLDEEL